MVWEVWRCIFGATSHGNLEQSGALTDTRLKTGKYWKQLPKFKDNRYRSLGVGRKTTVKSRDQYAGSRSTNLLFVALTESGRLEKHTFPGKGPSIAQMY